jgi:hypothetical protein
MPESVEIPWRFLNRTARVFMLGEKVAYSWVCDPDTRDDATHEHGIRCLWVWHDCDQNLDPVNTHGVGWKPTGVNAHTFHAADPLHIEASVYWPSCCGLHGWIRDGKWADA